MHTQTVNGSPPRMRGKVSSVQTASYGTGITPAYAGKSCICLARLLPTWDHPRVCGEKKRKGNSPHARTGSPPRMRGKDFHVGDGLRFAGITPAYAGKRGGFHRQLSRVKDHPRVCGEKNGENGLTFHQMGSPPRMRGKVSVKFSMMISPGITPAYAGKREPPRASAS